MALSDSDDDLAWEDAVDDDEEEDDDEVREDVEIEIAPEGEDGDVEVEAPRDYLTRRRPSPGTSNDPTSPAKKRPKLSREALDARKAWRARRVARHQAHVVVFCCRLRLLDAFCRASKTVDAARTFLPKHVFDRLRAAAKVNSGASEKHFGTLKAALLAAVRAAKAGAAVTSADSARRSSTSTSKKKPTFGSDPDTLAARAVKGTWTPADLAQLLCAAFRAAGLDDAILVGATSQPPACLKSDTKRRNDAEDDLLYVRVGQRYFVGADSAVSKRPPEGLYVVAYDRDRDDGRGFESLRAPPKLPKIGQKTTPTWFSDVALPALNGGLASCTSPHGGHNRGTIYPKTKGGFRSHATYALKSALFPYEHLKKEATCVGYFRGEKVYKRSDVEVLRSERQWKKRRRCVKEGEEPVRSHMFAERQTEAWEVPKVINDVLPVNEYGDVDIVDGDESMVPSGATWFRGNDAKVIAKRLDLPYALAMIGFEKTKEDHQNTASFKKKSGSSSGNTKSYPTAKPKKDGVVVADKYAPGLRVALEAHLEKKTRHRADAQRRAKRQRWALLVRKALSLARLKETYLDEEEAS